MKKGLWVVSGLVVILALLMGGCDQSRGMHEPPTHTRWSESELSEPPEGSIPPPGISILQAANLYVEHHIELKAGETVQTNIRLVTKEHGPGQVTYYKPVLVAGEYSKHWLPMPVGLQVTVEPSRFMAYPNNTYNSTMTVITTGDLPAGVYWLLFKAYMKGVMASTGWIEVDVK